ncbi:MAG: HEAT repeat domain-containing protein [Pyrinomonadaceae bacterium]
MPFNEEMHVYMSGRIRDLSDLGNFTTKTDDILRNDYPNSFWKCESLFKDLVNSNFVTDLINHELECMVADGLYTLSDFSTSGFYIVQTEKYSLGLAVLEDLAKSQESTLANIALNEPDASKRLFGLTSHHMIGVHESGSGLEIECYIQRAPFPIEILEKDKILERQETVILAPNEVKTFSAYKDAIRIVPPKSPSVVLYFTSANVGNIRWEYDTSTLAPSKAIATNMNSSRLQWAAECLSVLGNSESAKALEKLYSHPDHFVRWSALSNLIQIDFESGVALLQSAVDSDDHPHVRKAANESLRMLSQ